MKVTNPVRDRWLAGLLRRATEQPDLSAERQRALAQRIMLAAMPLLDERAGGPRGVWDDIERWAGMLIPAGTLTAIAAGLSLLWVSTSAMPSATPAAGTQTALIGAATNNVTAHDLVDLLVAPDGASRGDGQ